MKKINLTNSILIRSKLDYSLYRNDIQEENRNIFVFSFVAAFFICGIVSFCGLFGLKTKSPVYITLSITETCYCLILLFLSIFLREKVQSKYIIILLYSLQAPIFILSILNGTIFLGDLYTFNFFILILVLPLFIFDRPIRPLIINTAYFILYFVLDGISKSDSIFKIDTFHAIEAYFGSIILILLFLKIRFGNLENFINLREKSEHNDVTGLKNKSALRSSCSHFIHLPMFISMIDIDNFKFFNDMYGHQTGDLVLQSFAMILVQNFGKDACFSYGGDEFLIALQSTNEEDFKSRLRKALDGLSKLSLDKRVLVRPTFSAGYVYGKPLTREDFMDMIAKADYLLYNRKSKGKNSFSGKAYAEYKNSHDTIFFPMAKDITSKEKDKLTDLGNMNTFYIRGKEILGSPTFFDKTPVIIYFNLSNFKLYNEINGIEKGDLLLKDVSKLLEKLFPGRLISRLDNDKFSVLCYKDEFENNQDELENSPIFLTANPHCHLHAGICEIHRGSTLEDGIDKAILACEEVKKNSKIQFRYYDSALEKERNISLFVLSNFQNAIQSKAIKVFYQPIIRCMNGHISSFEALARWEDKNNGLISPAQFIPLLEEHGLIKTLDLYILDNLCQDFIHRKELGLSNIPVSFNLSKYDFQSLDLVDEIIATVDKYAIPHNLIIIEITESMMVDNPSILAKQINLLQKEHFRVWMDDFGSSYSSLNLLKDYNFDCIKLDMRFLTDSSNHEKAKIIIANIIRMANELGIHTLTEGVESQDDFLFLQDIGCERSQGYLFSKPLPFESLLHFLSVCPYPQEDIVEQPYFNLIGETSLTCPVFENGKLDLEESLSSIATIILEYNNHGKFRTMKSNKAYQRLAVKLSGKSSKRNGMFDYSWHPVSSPEIDRCILKTIQTKKFECVTWKNDRGTQFNLNLCYLSENPSTHYVALFAIIDKYGNDIGKLIQRKDW